MFFDFFRKSLIGSFFFLLIYFSSFQLGQEDENIKFYPADQITKFTLGFDNIVAYSFWLSFLQDDHICKQNNKVVSYNPAVSIKDILKYKLAPSRCHLGWAYQTVYISLLLDHEFKTAYRNAGEILAIVTDDREGAKRIFDKGVNLFPQYWELAYSASYHYLYELQEGNRAADLLVQAANSGGPQRFKSLAASIYKEGGNKELAIKVLTDFVNNNKEHHVYEAAKAKLEKIISSQK